MTEPSSAPRVAVYQDGSRRHYQVPLALHRAGLLDRMLTDWYSAPGTWERTAARLIRAVRPAVGKRMVERYCPDLAGVRTLSPSLSTLSLHLRRSSFLSEMDFFNALYERQARWLLGGRRLHGVDVLFGYSRHLHPMAAAGVKGRGIRLVVDQVIAPAVVEAEVTAEEDRRWPGWKGRSSVRDFAQVDAAERAAWDAADRVVCGSDYVRDGMIRCGVPADKVSVIPYTGVVSAHTPTPRSGPLTVGFVGAVGLRKGAPYFFQVAKRFDPKQVRFVMVGPIHLAADVLERERGPVEVVGPVPRSAVADWLGRFDLFFFPSTCEGSAGAVIEALGVGLPVLTSPNSGTSVRDGVEGYVSAYDDVDGFADRIRRLADDPDLRATMGRAARERHAVHHLDQYGRSLVELIGRLPPAPQPQR